MGTFFWFVKLRESSGMQGWCERGRERAVVCFPCGCHGFFFSCTDDVSSAVCLSQKKKVVPAKQRPAEFMVFFFRTV